MANQSGNGASKEYHAILLFGPPGSGKGTQGRILGEVPGFCLVSMGDVLRSLDPSGNPGREVHRHLRAGTLVPSELVIAVWKKHMEKRVAARFDPRRGLLVLDGLPRNVEEAKMLVPYVGIERVIHLACENEAILIDRIRRRSREGDRPDDTNDAVVQHRFDVYRTETLPVLDRYPPQAIAVVEAARTPLQVLHQIVGAAAIAHISATAGSES